MYLVKDFLVAMDSIAPFSLAESRDNVGLLAGGEDIAVTGALVALDATAAVLKEAAQLGANLLITHHPIIFHPLYRLEKDSIPWQMAEKGMSVICAHTNLDIVQDGVNDVLAKRLCLSDVRHLTEEGIGRVGELCIPMTAEVFAGYVKGKLQAPGVKYSDTGSMIRTVAICSGSGSDYWDAAARSGADAYLSGELAHHVWVDAVHRGVSLVEAGHFYTENPIVAPLAKKLGALLPEVKIHASQFSNDQTQFSL